MIGFSLMLMLIGCEDSDSESVSESVSSSVSELISDSESSSVNDTNSESLTESVQHVANNLDVQNTSNEEVKYIYQPEVEMSELRATADFNFSDKKQVTVSLDLTTVLELNQQTGERAYISIYAEYQLLAGRFYPDSSTRVLAGELQNGLFNHSFVALNNQSSYLIEVWFYNGETALQKEQQIIGNNLSW